MKTAILFYFLAASCFAQQVPEKVKKTTVNKDQVRNSSDAFAKASLVALKAIEADSSEPKLREGQFLVNGYVQKLIEAADLEASLIAERALVINLRGLMISKEANNTERSIVALKAGSDLYASHKTPNELCTLPEPNTSKRDRLSLRHGGSRKHDKFGVKLAKLGGPISSPRGVLCLSLKYAAASVANCSPGSALAD